MALRGTHLHRGTVEEVVASQALGALGQLCVAGGVPLWYEPTSVPKAGRLWDAAAQPALAAGTLPLP